MSKDDPDRFDRAVMAWHASPHDFDEFGPMRKVSGSGQGAAVYGRGAAYVAENPKVSGPGESEYMKEFAQHPATKGKAAVWQTDGGFSNGTWYDLDEDTHEELARPGQLFDGDHWSTWASDWLQNHLFHHPNDPQAIDRLREHIQDDEAFHLMSPKKAGTHSGLTKYMNNASFLIEDDLGFDKRHAEAIYNWFKKYGQALDAGLLFRHQPEQAKPQAGPFSYKVAVHLRPETTLDWDTILEKHHPEALDKVNQAFGRPEADWASNVQRIFGQVKDHTTYDGRSIYIALQRLHGSDYDASEALFNAGIHGIRYKDEGSRNIKSTVKFDGRELPGDEIDSQEPMAGTIAAWVINGGHTTIDSVEQYLQGRINAGRPKEKRYQQVYDELQSTLDFLKANRGRFEVAVAKPTYNYVVFHPDFVEALAQYNIKGEKIRDIGPGVHLKAVDHDPFQGEDK